MGSLIFQGFSSQRVPISRTPRDPFQPIAGCVISFAPAPDMGPSYPQAGWNPPGIGGALVGMRGDVNGFCKVCGCGVRSQEAHWTEFMASDPDRISLPFM